MANGNHRTDHGRAKRAALLIRAIESIESQCARPLVVVNGARFDPSLMQKLSKLQRIRLLRVAEPGQANAIHVGRLAVTAEYFGFLDDDDYLLPGSIAARENFLAAQPQFDAVVANGLREEWHESPRLYRHPSDVKRIEDDPMAALLKANWLTPCGGYTDRRQCHPRSFWALPSTWNGRTCLPVD